MLKKEQKALKGDDRYEGFAVDIIRELSLKLGFNYTFIVEEDMKYGERLSNGSWNGMIGRLMDDVITNSLCTVYT